MTDAVVPARWEWRAFGAHFDPLPDAVAAALSEPRTTHELYLLSDRRDVNAKIRQDQLDVKVLQHVDTNRLEQWAPVLKSTFPVAASVVAELFGLWRTDASTVTSADFTRDAFLDLVAALSGVVDVVAVTKARRTGRFDGCLVERSQLSVAGTAMETIAVEMEDPVQVLRVVRALNLSHLENVNYPKALRRFLEAHGTSRTAALWRAHV